MRRVGLLLLLLLLFRVAGLFVSGRGGRAGLGGLDQAAQGGGGSDGTWDVVVVIAVTGWDESGVSSGIDRGVVAGEPLDLLGQTQDNCPCGLLGIVQQFV